MMKKLPVVALIGQTNAGKSSLLNRLARKNIAIVAREAGTTRDNVVATIDDRFILVDTAGLKDPTDDFEASIQEQILDAISSADVILAVLDSTKYFDHRDRKIVKDALKSGKPVFLVLNKCDLRESLPIEEFRALGVAPERMLFVSATTGAGISGLKKKVSEALAASGAFAPWSKSPRSGDSAPELTVPYSNRDRGHFDAGLGADSPRAPLKRVENPNRDFMHSKKPVSATRAPLKLALIGRPNVGKSSLFNSLSKKQQAIVSSRQGTTRDVNRVQVRYKGRELEILDTAGLRKPGKREVGIEKFSAIRTLAAIEEVDVCALLVDATEPHSKLDQALAGQIIEAGKGIVVVVTKTDLIKNRGSEQRTSATPKDEAPRQADGKTESPFESLLDDLERDFNFLPYAPVLLTSSETGENVTQLFELALQIEAARKTEVKTSELNKILNEAIISHPPAGLKNTRPKPKYIVQTDVCPPWFVVHGHDLELLHWSWKRFLERKIREKYPFVGTPVMFSWRSEKK